MWWLSQIVDLPKDLIIIKAVETRRGIGVEVARNIVTNKAVASMTPIPENWLARDVAIGWILPAAFTLSLWN